LQISLGAYNSFFCLFLVYIIRQFACRFLSEVTDMQCMLEAY